MGPPTVPAGLLHEACAPIRYRVRLEILGEPRDAAPMRALQADILDDPLVRRIAGGRQPDGWLGRDFHGRQGMETAIRVLVEKGVDPAGGLLSAALAALVAESERFRRGLGRPGAVLDRRGFGGERAIRAACLAMGGREDLPLVREQTGEALVAFDTVARTAALDEVMQPWHGRVVFRPGVRWPGIYHLRILAWTREWRSTANLDLVRRAVERLVALSPLPHALVRDGSSLVAPASFAMADFDPDMRRLDDAAWMAWFHRMELLARTGVVSGVPALARQVDVLQALLLSGDGWFTVPLAHRYFIEWGAYTGLALEADWRSARRRSNDLTFRSLLVLQHAGGSTPGRVAQA
jgi:hypothetical protein